MPYKHVFHIKQSIVCLTLGYSTLVCVRLYLSIVFVSSKDARYITSDFIYQFYFIIAAYHSSCQFVSYISSVCCVVFRFFIPVN